MANYARNVFRRAIKIEKTLGIAIEASQIPFCQVVRQDGVEVSVSIILPPDCGNEVKFHDSIDFIPLRTAPRPVVPGNN